VWGSVENFEITSRHDGTRKIAKSIVTFLPFLFCVGMGLKTPAEQVRERIDRLKGQFRTN
jgi:hypothetical protein